ncbi:ROK family transcriptional regulator [Brachybacterium vulturis]|nr:ROK family transcriptional regulator [Brachybacterium vulturis]
MLSSSKERALATLISQGPMHRADLARALEVSRTTVTNVTQELLADGMLDSDQGTALRSKLWITHAAGVIVSVVCRLRSTVVAVSSLDGRTTALRSATQEPYDLGGHRLTTATHLIEELLAQIGNPPVLAGHVAVNTQIDVLTGEIVGGRASKRWTGFNPRTTMEGALGAPVAIENTSRLLALAEHHMHSNGQAHNLIYVHLSHGITMGQILHGTIVQGSHGGAGELGHMSIDLEGLPCECGNRGCLMQYVDEQVVSTRASAILGADATVDDLVASANDGSRACRSLIADIGGLLGKALVGVCHLLDPDVIVLGGELARAGDLLIDPVRQNLHQRALPLNARGLSVTAASASLSETDVASAGFHILRSDPHHVSRMLHAISDRVET